MKSKQSSSRDFRTGDMWSRTIDTISKVKNSKNRSVVKLKKDITNYQDMPSGGRRAMNTRTEGYKKVYKNGVLKKHKIY